MAVEVIFILPLLFYSTPAEQLNLMSHARSLWPASAHFHDVSVREGEQMHCVTLGPMAGIPVVCVHGVCIT